MFNGNQCVDTAVARYFVDVTLPPPSLHCQILSQPLSQLRNAV